VVEERGPVAKDGLNRTRVFGESKQVAFICRVVEVLDGRAESDGRD
jgi:hypothetical protein